jgi:hypothetical protein
MILEESYNIRGVVGLINDTMNEESSSYKRRSNRIRVDGNVLIGDSFDI